jgi:hypothetical protein
LKRTFTVGNLEKHSVAIEVSFWSREARIFLDGKEVPKDVITQSANSPGSSQPRLTFSFGERERHVIEIDYGSGFPPGSTLAVYADGKPVEWPVEPSLQPAALMG